MSPRLLLVAHAPLASALATAAKTILGPPMLSTVAIDFDHARAEGGAAREIVAALGPSAHANTLVLVDVAGASPCNSVLRAAGDRRDIEIVAGLSLAMLLRVYNYYDSDLATLATLAAEAGSRSTARLTPPA